MECGKTDRVGIRLELAWRAEGRVESAPRFSVWGSAKVIASRWRSNAMLPGATERPIRAARPPEPFHTESTDRGARLNCNP